MSSVATSSRTMGWNVNMDLSTKSDDFIEITNAGSIDHGARLISQDEFKSLLCNKKALPMIILAGFSLLTSLGFLFIWGISSLTIAFIVGLPFVAIVLLLLPALLARFISISRRE